MLQSSADPIIQRVRVLNRVIGSSGAPHQFLFDIDIEPSPQSPSDPYGVGPFSPRTSIGSSLCAPQNAQRLGRRVCRCGICHNHCIRGELGLQGCSSLLRGSLAYSRTKRRSCRRHRRRSGRSSRVCEKAMLKKTGVAPDAGV